MSAIVLGALLGLVLGCQLGFLTTTFIRPKGLWKLVPFRVGGWRSAITPHKVYRTNWMWQKLDFDDFYIKESK